MLDVPADQQELRDKLIRIAYCYLIALNMSDDEHEDFADSGADVVEQLWIHADLVKDTIAELEARNGESHSSSRF